MRESKVRRVTVLLVMCLMAGMASRAWAQYYEKEAYEPTTSRFISGGVQFMDFAPRPSNPLGDSLSARFTRVMPMIGLRQGTVDIAFGYTRYTLHGTSHPMIYLGASVAMELSLSGKPSSALLLPVFLSADFTRAEVDNLQRDDFNVGSFGIGTGLRYRVRGDRIEFTATAMAGVQYSFEGYSSSSGSSVLGIGDAVLHLYDVLVADGIAIGYRFRVESWSMGRSVANYRAISHGPYLGIMF